MTELVNLNTAQPDELTSLPGVGPAMAARILAARPFETRDDLLQVSGVGPALLERLQPLVTLEQAGVLEKTALLVEGSGTQPEAEDPPPEAESQPETESDESQPEDESIPPWDEFPPEEDVQPSEDEISDAADTASGQPEESETGESSPKHKPVTRGQALFMAAACSSVAFILALLLSIGIIGSVNGGLRFASEEQVMRLGNQIDGLTSQAEVLAQEVEGLRARLDNLEGLSGRVGDLEAEAEQLSADMARTVDIVEGMSAQIEEILSSTERFQAFLNGLNDLLDALAQP